jgi:hypothetical protein
LLAILFTVVIVLELQAQSETAPKLKLGNSLVIGAAYEDPLSLIVAKCPWNRGKDRSTVKDNIRLYKGT